MKKKIITAVVLVCGLVLAIASKLLTPFVFDAFIALIMVALTYECSTLLTKSKKYNFMFANMCYALVLCAGLIVGVCFNLAYYYIFAIMLGSLLVYYFFVYVVGVMVRESNHITSIAEKLNLSCDKTVFKMSLNSMCIGVYTCVCPSFFILLNHIGDIDYLNGFETNALNISFTVLVIAFLIPIICDTFAMFGGMLFKGPKLAPTISPNKTVSGAVIGTCFTMLVLAGTYLILCLIPETLQVLKDININILNFILLGLLGALASQCGDLFESLLKRKANVKDVSNLLPGHGGFMDRLDSHILSVPLTYIFFFFFIIL